MFKLMMAILALAFIVFFVGVRVASANTDADWAIHTDIDQPTVNLINLDGYQIEYWSGEGVLRLGHSFTGSADTLTIRVANAIPAYDLTTYPATITSCVTRD